MEDCSSRHAPQGDTYADLLFTMIERRSSRPPVTYTTFEARDLGGDTAELFKTAVVGAYERWAPQAMIVGPLPRMARSTPPGSGTTSALVVAQTVLHRPYRAQRLIGAADNARPHASQPLRAIGGAPWPQLHDRGLLIHRHRAEGTPPQRQWPLYANNAGDWLARVVVADPLQCPG